jgi:hypothetical protein
VNVRRALYVLGWLIVIAAVILALSPTLINLF